jgi:hypothetical protein
MQLIAPLERDDANELVEQRRWQAAGQRRANSWLNARPRRTREVWLSSLPLRQVNLPED